MTIMKPINLKDVAGGRSPALLRRQIANGLNTTSTQDIISGPGRVRTIDITSPGGRVQRTAYFDNRPTSRNLLKKVGYGLAYGGAATAAGFAFSDAIDGTHWYGNLINKED